MLYVDTVPLEVGCMSKSRLVILYAFSNMYSDYYNY